MNDPNSQVVERVALNRGVPRLWVMILILASCLLAGLALLIALKLAPQATLGVLACALLLFSWWWYWNGRDWKNKHDHSDDWERVAFVEHRDEKIVFVPDRRMRSVGYTTSEAPFPVGSRLEYRIETGDRYFTGDHAQVLSRSFWAVEPDGSSHRLLDSAISLNVETAARNLHRIDIPFRVIRDYDGQDGKHSETDITSEYLQAAARKRAMSPVTILLGTSSLWLGALFGAFARNPAYVITAGFLGYVVIAVLLFLSEWPKRASVIDLVALIPSWAAGYATMAVIFRHVAGR